MGVCTHQLQRHGILNEAAPTKLQRACLLHYLRPAVGDGKGKGVVPFLKNSKEPNRGKIKGVKKKKCRLRFNIWHVE